MNIREKFLELTSRTYPHGTESDIFPLLGEGLQADDFGNLFIKIGESDVMFTAHLDTATSALSQVNHVFERNIIKTDGKSILGADDKAGVAIMLNMIENRIPGLYFFFLGEEVGCVGSRKAADAQKDKKIEGINKVISFDRRGKSSVITYQSGSRCCSDTFGTALGKALNDAEPSFKYENDDTGILTDSIQFVGIYSECTNISVGYQNEHTGRECQDIDFLRRLCITISNVDWETLPISRNPLEEEEFDYGSLYGYDEREENPEWLNENYTHVLLDGKTKKVYVATSRIIDEKAAIAEWVATRQEYIGTRDIVWNGHSLYVESKSGHLDFVGVRSDIMEMVEELKSIPKSKISETIPGKKKTFMNVF